MLHPQFPLSLYDLLPQIFGWPAGYGGGCETTCANIMKDALYGGGPDIKCTYVSDGERILNLCFPHQKSLLVIARSPSTNHPSPSAPVLSSGVPLFYAADGCPG